MAPQSRIKPKSNARLSIAALSQVANVLKRDIAARLDRITDLAISRNAPCAPLLNAARANLLAKLDGKILSEVLDAGLAHVLSKSLANEKKRHLHETQQERWRGRSAVKQQSLTWLIANGMISAAPEEEILSSTDD